MRQWDRVLGPLSLAVMGVVGLLVHALPAVSLEQRAPLVGLWGLVLAVTVGQASLSLAAELDERGRGAVSDADASEYRAAVWELAGDLGISMPAVTVVETADPIAMVDQSRLRPHLYVSDSLFERLPPDERTAVLGHELGHVRSHDALLAIASSYVVEVTGATVLWLAVLRHAPVTVQVGGVVVYLATGVLTSSRATVLWLALGGFTQLPLLVLSQTVSRWREYRADQCALACCSDPAAVERALTNVSLSAAAASTPAPGDVPRYSDRRTWIDRLLASHPPLDARLERLVR
ncbi:M48 family metalloprotease [Halobacteria archaeon HArc-gm2]|nr:M48 family metalloprotease [Halobacteria archaeon HArc-gm2]